MKLWIKRTAIAASVLAVVLGGGWLYLQKNPRTEEPKFRLSLIHI